MIPSAPIDRANFKSTNCWKLNQSRVGTWRNYFLIFTPYPLSPLELSPFSSISVLEEAHETELLVNALHWFNLLPGTISFSSIRASRYSPHSLISFSTSLTPTIGQLRERKP
mmetsp:Transcript_13532/g.17553  ORF Transcript_13532/g.17553 Transcript_13532/m.17553 type:complete len:112 (+) Transcript_13532:569-904(+)